MWIEITYPFPNFNGCTVETSEWISKFTHTLLGMWLLVHVGIEVNPCQKKVALWVPIASILEQLDHVITRLHSILCAAYLFMFIGAI